MANLQYLIGDALDCPKSDPVYLVHCVNDIGGWGSGFVVALTRRWPNAEKAYRRWHAKELMDGTCQFELGNIQVVKVDPKLPNFRIVNLIGQHRTINHGEAVPVRYEAIRKGLTTLAQVCLKQNPRGRVCMPRMGAGLARGDWSVIEKIIQETLVDRGIEVSVYDLPT